MSGKFSWLSSLKLSCLSLYSVCQTAYKPGSFPNSNQVVFVSKSCQTSTVSHWKCNVKHSNTKLQMQHNAWSFCLNIISSAPSQYLTYIADRQWVALGQNSTIVTELFWSQGVLNQRSPKHKVNMFTNMLLLWRRHASGQLAVCVIYKILQKHAYTFCWLQ